MQKSDVRIDEEAHGYAANVREKRCHYDNGEFQGNHSLALELSKETLT